MKYSEFFLKTLKSTPKGADTIGTENLLRGGYIAQVGSGLFSYLPLGYIVLKKVENIIDEELKNVGVVNVLAPILQPASYWKESGRYSEIGDEMMRIKTKAGEEYVLAMTAEELFSDIAKNYIESYKDLPIIINQFQTKIRNEVRPKGGLMRVKEFIMQDAYSFDLDKKEMDKSYKKIFVAYERIFKKLEIDFLSVEADVGAMGGKESAEFVVICDAGEAKIANCSKCEYSANQEVAETAVLPSEDIKKKKTKEIVETPNMKTIEELSEYLKIDEKETLKSVIYKVKDQKILLMVVIRGDLKINETKLTNYLNGSEYRNASDEDLDKLGLVAGYLSPISKNTNIKVIADYSVKTMVNFTAGANKEGQHYNNVNLSDLNIDEFVDLVSVESGASCPRCFSRLEIKKAIELGHTFKLGTRYSKSMGVIYKDDKDKEQLVQMGSYGIGLGRIMQSIAELNSDDVGIIWPKSIAPFQIYLINIADPSFATHFAKATRVKNASEGKIGEKITEEFYKKLLAKGIEVLYDDRAVSPGIKFNDGDLVGVPIRITISNRTLAKNSFEVKDRKTGKESLHLIKDFDKMIEKL